MTILFGICAAESQAADEYWRTDGTSGTWTSANWNIGSATATGGTGWTNANNAVFTANSTITFATSTVGNVTVSDGVSVTITQAGTLSLGGVRTFDIGTGATLTWQTQNMTANSAGGITKNGAGILDLGAMTWTTNMNGGFTLNNGTVIVSGNKALGNGSLTFNAGTLQSSGTRAFTPTAITIGGDFALSGTGNANWDAATTISIGSSTRTITNNTTSGSRQFRGLISGGTGAGLTFAGNGGAQIYIGNTGNSFTGPIAINGGEVVFNGNGALGSTTSITLDGGRLTIGSMDTSGSTSASTAVTIDSSKNIFVGAGVGTSISISGSTGDTTYNGVIANKPSSTGGWAKQGAGTLHLGGVSTYTGDTSINNGNIQLTTGNNRLPTGTTISLGQATSANLGTFDLNGYNQQIAGLNSTSGTNATTSNNTVTSASAATLTIGGAGTYSYGDGTNANSGVITGAISLVKQGNGTQTLGDTNTYTGTTNVNSGTLLVNGSIASATTVSNTGATLGGSGTITGNVNINSGAILAPGNGAGILTVAGTTSITTLSADSIFAWELGSEVDHNGSGSEGTRGMNYDGLTSTNLSVASGAVFRVILSSAPTTAFWKQTETWDNIFNVSGTTTEAVTGHLFDTFQVYNGSTDITSATTASQGYFTMNGSTLTWTAVPEPTGALVGLLIGAGLLRRRRAGV